MPYFTHIVCLSRTITDRCNCVSLYVLVYAGSFIEQGTRSIVWVTSILLGLVLLLFWTLAWCTFLCVQLIEDGTPASLIPYSLISTLLFVGFTYICLDTGFSVSGYFDTDASSLHNNWLFTILITLSGIFVLFTVVISTWVSGMFLRERRPLRTYSQPLPLFTLHTDVSLCLLDGDPEQSFTQAPSSSSCYRKGSSGSSRSSSASPRTRASTAPS